MPSIEGTIGQQIGYLNDLYGKETSRRPDVTAGIYGEEARFKKGIGASLAAGGSDVKGSYNLSPLFEASASFSGRRMTARNAAEQARIMNLLNITKSFSGPIANLLGLESLNLEKARFEEEKAFNWANLMPNVNISAVNLGT